MFQVDFGELSQINHDFLASRVLVKKCPTHSLLASIKRSENKTKVENICCQRFATMIGNALSVHNINESAVFFRGKILNVFCELELFIDGIIEMTHLLFPSDFANGIPNELGMREKKELFKICLLRYNKLTGINTDKIWGNFSNIVEKRNHLAHWSVDTGNEAMQLLMKKKIRFVNTKRTVIVEEDVYDSKKSADLIMKIEGVTVEITIIYRYLRNLMQGKN